MQHITNKSNIIIIALILLIAGSLVYGYWLLFQSQSAPGLVVDEEQTDVSRELTLAEKMNILEANNVGTGTDKTTDEKMTVLEIETSSETGPEYTLEERLYMLKQ